MQLREWMEVEITSLELNPTTFKYILEEVEDICLCIKFKNSVYHVVLPKQQRRNMIFKKIEEAFKKKKHKGN